MIDLPGPWFQRRAAVLAAYPVGGDAPRNSRALASAGLMILSSEERTSATSRYSNISSTQGYAFNGANSAYSGAPVRSNGWTGTVRR